MQRIEQVIVLLWHHYARYPQHHRPCLLQPLVPDGLRDRSVRQIIPSFRQILGIQYLQVFGVETNRAVLIMRNAAAITNLNKEFQKRQGQGT